MLGYKSRSLAEMSFAPTPKISYGEGIVCVALRGKDIYRKKGNLLKRVPPGREGGVFCENFVAFYRDTHRHLSTRGYESEVTYRGYPEAPRGEGGRTRSFPGKFCSIATHMTGRGVRGSELT